MDGLAGWRVEGLERADVGVEVGGQDGQDLAEVVQVVVGPFGDVGVYRYLAVAGVLDDVGALLARVKPEAKETPPDKP